MVLAANASASRISGPPTQRKSARNLDPPHIWWPCPLATWQLSLDLTSCRLKVLSVTTRIGQLEVSYTARGIPTYRVEIWHDGLKKHRLIKSSEAGVVQRKVEIQAADWDEHWSQVKAREKDRRDKQGQKKLAAQRTLEAQRELDLLNKVLEQTLGVNDAIDWERLKDNSAFPEPRPVKPKPPAKPRPQNRPREPEVEDAAFIPKLGLLDKLIGSRRERLIAESHASFSASHERWEREAQAVDSANQATQVKYDANLREQEEEHKAQLRDWDERRTAFAEKQRLKNEAVEKQRSAYKSGLPDAISEYCDMVLSASVYPDYFPQEFSLDYNPESKILVVDYLLPAPDCLPKVREVKYVATRDEFAEQYLSQSQLDKIYDELLYQIALRTVHELFEADTVAAIAAVAFNGIVTSTDRSTGQQVTACVLSLQVQRDEFMAVNLASVEPKACFKALKGVGSAKLHSLAAVAPIMQMRREDGRFVSAYEVASTLDESSNLAAMDWEDFEHLIREVFEQEFSSGGGEVKVTQASRDGGVDAIAFDPDPIRGGKIVIQAKRYTNTVSVGAVRDLYGTVMNEGANKGILVTTSDYGPDAYAFAKGKPLNLLNGANLLHMLEKHGHKVRIDLQEARRTALNQPSR